MNLLLQKVNNHVRTLLIPYLVIGHSDKYHLITYLLIYL